MGDVIYLRRQQRNRAFDMPFAQINITPLIDVMLVLLVMLILAVPAAMHQTTIEMPNGPPPVTNDNPVAQNISVSSDGAYHWNGAVIDDAALDAKLRTLAAVGDELRIETDGYARYERFNSLIAMVKKAGVNKIGFVGNYKYKQWDRPV